MNENLIEKIKKKRKVELSSVLSLEKSVNSTVDSLIDIPKDEDRIKELDNTGYLEIMNTISGGINEIISDSLKEYNLQNSYLRDKDFLKELYSNKNKVEDILRLDHSIKNYLNKLIKEYLVNKIKKVNSPSEIIELLNQYRQIGNS